MHGRGSPAGLEEQRESRFPLSASFVCAKGFAYLWSLETLTPDHPRSRPHGTSLQQRLGLAGWGLLRAEVQAGGGQCPDGCPCHSLHMPKHLLLESIPRMPFRACGHRGCGRVRGMSRAPHASSHLPFWILSDGAKWRLPLSRRDIAGSLG